jgi:hypothetical protein
MSDPNVKEDGAFLEEQAEALHRFPKIADEFRAIASRMLSREAAHEKTVRATEDLFIAERAAAQKLLEAANMARREYRGFGTLSQETLNQIDAAISLYEGAK